MDNVEYMGFMSEQYAKMARMCCVPDTMRMSLFDWKSMNEYLADYWRAKYQSGKAKRYEERTKQIKNQGV